MKLLALIALLTFTAAACSPPQVQETFMELEIYEISLPVVETGISFVPEQGRPSLIERPELPEPEPIFPNEVGEIMVLVYHGLHEENPSEFDRLTADFWNDLQTLYDQGYRLISMADLVNNNIRTPAGYTPVVFTFDDGVPSAFSLMENEDGTLSPVPGTAVYIMLAFYEENPDFGLAATFFINGHPEPFRGAGTMQERFSFLLDKGFELGNHGFTHANFAQLNATQLQREIGRLDQFIRYHAPEGHEVLTLAYPFGIRPRPRLRGYAMAGEYNGVAYSHSWAFRVGNTFVPPLPHHVNFDATNVSRVIASDVSTPHYAVADLGFFLRLFERYPHLRFISDGDPDTITVPNTHVQYVNKENLAGKELVVYKIYEETPYKPMQLDYAG